MDELRSEKEKLLRHLLVVEEDDATRSACVEIAIQNGFYAYGLSSVESVQELLRGHTPDLLLLDMSAERRKDLQLLEELKTFRPESVVTVMTASTAIGFAVETMRRGATDYLIKPFLMEELTAALERAVQQQQATTVGTCSQPQRGADRIGNLIGCSPEMEKLYRIMSKSALSRHPVLIVGESGTGKELVARTMHAQSEIAAQPFLAVNCGTVDTELIEQELFGHMEDASPDEPGALARAESGTIFLDEIGQLSPDLQTKLMRALQEKEVRPTGASYGIPMRARILAATTGDLAAAVTKGAFRKDLYYRLSVVTLRIPPLRERQSDIPLLAAHFLERMGQENGENYTLSDGVLDSLMDYHWPLNVRELESLIQRACTMATGRVINMIDLPTYVQNHQLELRRSARPMQESIPEVERTRDSTRVLPLAEVEKQAILGTIKQLNGDKPLAARLLGIGKTTLYRKLKDYGLAENARPEEWDYASMAQ